MKKLIPAIILCLAAAATVISQTAQNQSSPPRATSAFSNAGPGLPGAPAAAGLPSTPANSGLPGFTNAFGGINLTNQSGSNLIPANLGPLLANLENDMVQLLPVLASFNNSFDFGVLSPEAEATTGAGLSGQNFSSSAGQNFSQRTSGNAGVNASSSVGGTPLPGNATPRNAGAQQGTLSPTGAPTGAGATPGFTSNPATNSLVLSGAARGTLRELLILESDLERSLPIVNALNGGGDLTGVLPNNFNPLFGGTNQLNFPAGAAPPNPSSPQNNTTRSFVVPTPTGRR